MSATTLLDDRAQEAVRAALAAARGGSTVLPNELRDALVRTLARALAGPAALAEYLAILEAESQPGDTPARGRRPPEGLPTAEVLRGGVSALADGVLLAVATGPEALRGLESDVQRAGRLGELGRAWDAVYDEIADDLPLDYLRGDKSRRMADEIVLIERPPDDAPPNPPRPAPPPGIRTPRWAVAGLGVAASLLIGFALGTVWSGGAGRHEVRLASVAVRGDATRGIDDVALDVTSAADRRAFVTVVGLVPGRKTPGYYSRQEKGYIEVPPGGTAVIKNLPPEFAGSTVLLVVLTPTPAGGVVREVTPPAATPETAEVGAEQIRKALADLGIPADVRVVPLPPAKR